MNDNILKEMGMKNNWIYETIVTTRSWYKINASPMGIRTSDMKIIILEIFKTSITCKNILRNKEFIINFIDDLEVFYSALLNKKAKWKYILDGSRFFKMHVLRFEDLGDKIRFFSKITDYCINSKPNLINRAEYLTLESLILFTRFFFTKSYTNKILLLENFRIVKKVAPNSKYESIMEKIIKFVK